MKYIMLSILCFILYGFSYPTPTKEKNMLFYIQRSKNKNTVIYQANYDSNGWLDPLKPVNIYWRLYEEGEKVEALNRIEKKYAYGLETYLERNNTFRVMLVAHKEVVLKLIQKKPFQAKVYWKEKGEEMQSLHHLFIHADDSALWPKVSSIEIFTFLTNSNTLQKRTVMVPD
ncbi:DUF4833 domain-containing protein [Halosquirtibacter laminarini]|uniref:DUF4833 domain-containing protein n=1 Tax=Halosquirtibacter laminarini TaxID=3374600 RepID=A0AC61NB95_9BACT|nr:DUF4833 domain-containing protein [Prolixibacteraceae bacterium]